jgi:hypothetical protein
LSLRIQAAHYTFFVSVVEDPTGVVEALADLDATTDQIVRAAGLSTACLLCAVTLLMSDSVEAVTIVFLTASATRKRSFCWAWMLRRGPCARYRTKVSPIPSYRLRAGETTPLE